MTRSKILPAALTAILLVAGAAPAFATSIRHTNRAEGDPEATSAPSGHAQPPLDGTAPHVFDKAHETDRSR